MKRTIFILLLLALGHLSNAQPMKVSFLTRQFLVNDVYYNLPNPNAISLGGVDSVHAVGNSITFGLNGPPGDGSTWQSYDSSYINRFIDSTGIPVENDGVSGTGLWQALQNLISDTMHSNDRSALIFSAGYNDIRYVGGEHPGIKRRFKEVLRMAGLLQFMKRTSFKAAGDCDVSNLAQWTRNFFRQTYSHTYYLEPSKYEALNTAGADTSTWIKYDFDGDNVAFAFTVNDSLDAEYSWINDEWDIYVDNVKQNTSVFTPFNYGGGNIGRWGWEVQPPSNCMILRGFGGGTHTLKIKKRIDNSGNGTMFDFFCTLESDTSLVRPIVIMEIQKQTAAGYTVDPAYDESSDAEVDAINTIIREMVTYWQNLGYKGKIISAPINSYYTPATDEDTDKIHPKNTTGHRHWWQALKSVISY